MRTNRRVLYIALFSIVLSLLFSVLIEWNVVTLTLLCRHKSFALSCLTGIFASSLLAAATSWITYREAKYECYDDYMISLSDIEIKGDFIVRLAIAYRTEIGVQIPARAIGELKSHLSELLKIAENINQINRKFAPIIHSQWWNKALGEKIYNQKKFVDSFNEVYQKLFVCYPALERTMLPHISESDLMSFYNQFQKSFMALVNLLGADSTFNKEKEAFKHSLNRLYHIKEDTTDDNA